jgi:hypothetical protein
MGAQTCVGTRESKKKGGKMARQRAAMNTYKLQILQKVSPLKKKKYVLGN